MKFLPSIFTFIFMGCSVTKSTQSMHQFTGGEVGCGNFIVYKLTESNDEYVSIALNASELEFEEFQAYAIGKTDIMEVKHKKFDGPINQALCNDVMGKRPAEILEETATSGVVEILVSEVEREKAKKKEGYRATIVLRNVLFEGITIDYLRLENMYVGWLPG